jgi:endoglucanase
MAETNDRLLASPDRAGESAGRRDVTAARPALSGQLPPSTCRRLVGLLALAFCACAAPVVTLDAGGGVDAGEVSLWLHTEGNRILRADGTPWRGRGANLHDTRGCNACAYDPPSPAEVARRIDALVDDWGATFIRLLLESYASPEGRVSWRPVTEDPQYLEDLRAIVAHARTKPDLYVMVSLWHDPSFSPDGWPTAQTAEAWRALVRAFKDEPRVLFGLVNEPEANFDGAFDAEVWAAMNATVQAIRDEEAAVGSRPHLVAVQGTRNWARSLDYYLTHPIAAGGGVNVVYETHVYDPPAEFSQLFEVPAQTLPVIIGEFGPAGMTEDDCMLLMERARALDVPHLGWSFHHRCPPNLIEARGRGCGIDMELVPTSWGQRLKAGLAVPWGP